MIVNVLEMFFPLFVSCCPCVLLVAAAGESRSPPGLLRPGRPRPRDMSMRPKS